MQYIESLETRRLFASFTASSVAELIGNINAANAAGGSNTITLTPGATFKLNAAISPVNVDDGPNGLPLIAAGNALTIFGNGNTIQRSTARATPAFRLFDVAIGGSLTLNNLTLSGGLASTSSTFDISSLAAGGAILSRGTLNLSGVIVQNSIARAQNWDFAYGGGVFSNGVLTISNSVIQNNQAVAGTGKDLSGFAAGVGRPAWGGGLYLAGSATITDTIISSNLAREGDGENGFTLKGRWGLAIVRGGAGGDAFGGGIYVGAGTLQLLGTTITQNAATGGSGGGSVKGLPDGANGSGHGGGIYIYPGSLVSLDSFTFAHAAGNSASTSDNDIFGSFTLL